MDILTIASAAILLTIVSLPFVLAFRNKKKKESRLNNELSALANRSFVSVSQKEFNGNVALGLDNEKKKILYVMLNGSDAKTKAFNLDEFKKSSVKCHYRELEKSDAEKLIEKIYLVLESGNQNSSDATLELFNHSHASFLDDELNFAKKWSEKLNNECFPKLK